MADNIFTITTGDTLMGQQYVDTFRRSEHLEVSRPTRHAGSIPHIDDKSNSPRIVLAQSIVHNRCN
jgi:hypothetical protein